MAGYNQNNIY